MQYNINGIVVYYVASIQSQDNTEEAVYDVQQWINPQNQVYWMTGSKICLM